MENDLKTEAPPSNDLAIEANLAKFGFHVGQEVEVEDFGDHYGAIRTYGPVIAYPKKTRKVKIIGGISGNVIIELPNNGWTCNKSGLTIIHSSIKANGSTKAWSCLPPALLTKERLEALKPKEPETFTVSGRTFSKGEKLWGVLLGLGQSEVLFSHANFEESYSPLLRSEGDARTSMVSLEIIGPSSTIDGHVKVSYGRDTINIQADAIYMENRKPQKLVELERHQTLLKAGFDVGDECQILTANYDTPIARYRRDGETLEEYAKYVEETSGTLLWQTAKIIGIHAGYNDIAKVEFIAPDGTILTDIIGITNLHKKGAPCPEPFATQIKNQDLKKYGLKVGDKVKSLRTHRKDGCIFFENDWRNTDFASYTKNTDEPTWVEGTILKMEMGNINVAHGNEVVLTFEPGAIFPLTAEFPPEVLAKFPPKIIVKSKIKKEAISVANRIAATQITKLIKQALLRVISTKADNQMVVAIQALLDTELGEAMIASMIGLALSNLPKDHKLQFLANEFQITGMALAGNTILDSLIQEIIPLFNMSSFQEEVIRIVPEKNENFIESIEEMNPKEDANVIIAH